MSKTILLIEDDYALAMGTTYTLKAEGYEVLHAKNLAEARNQLGGEVDIILLDVMLPDGDGFSFLEELMSKDIDIPVVFSTAVGDEVNIVRGLDLGADDYITKPYKVKEMLSRIAAVLRRQERARRTVEKQNKDSEITFGSHRFSISAFRLYKGDEVVECTPAELRLLREFIVNKGIVITRNQLMERLYDTENAFIDDNTLSVYIKRLRDKLGEDASYIRTVKGIGYRFEDGHDQ
ncbi:DNA-binding response regulator, OmpR family, contains REC and winged-helix (wHTH) domain [Lachnospiraceae bacterium]|nr:DNA-binding response regulator, OmpR family, contains REC and winged-helix (wHTH) domain [Lachnospiraceae bacterium]